jgi:hypothetical protein
MVRDSWPREVPRHESSSLMVVRFGSFRGDADRRVRLRGEEVAGAAPLPTAPCTRCRWLGRRFGGFGRRDGCAVAGARSCQTAPPPQPNTQQTAAATNPDADLFLPSLQGYRNNPTRFVLRRNTVTADQAPPTGAFTGSAVPAIPAAPPVYGSPTGFGAGNTGFDSTNARRKQRARVPNGGTRDCAAAGVHHVRFGAHSAAGTAVATAGC